MFPGRVMSALPSRQFLGVNARALCRLGRVDRSAGQRGLSTPPPQGPPRRGDLIRANPRSLPNTHQGPRSINPTVTGSPRTGPTPKNNEKILRIAPLGAGQPAERRLGEIMQPQRRTVGMAKGGCNLAGYEKIRRRWHRYESCKCARAAGRCTALPIDTQEGGFSQEILPPLRDI
jgi:hypothetical protein